MKDLLKALWQACMFAIAVVEEALQGDYIPPVAPETEPQEPLPTKPVPMTNSEKLYNVAFTCIGKDMSPLDVAPDSLGCAESLNGVYFKAFGERLGTGAALTSTKALYESMLKDERLEQVTLPEKGVMVLSPSGYSDKGAKHGHCGIWGNFDVMSNDSNSGLWMSNYTHEAWDNVFVKTLGFPTFYFKVK